MHEDEDARVRPPRPATRFTPARLDSWDVAELRDYIAALREEIGRAEAAIAKQDTHRNAAEALFRRS